MTTASTATVSRIALGVLVPAVAVLMLVLVLAAAGAQASPASAVCGGGGTGATVGDVPLDAEQLGNARTIVAVAAGRRLPPYAGVVAVATSYTEVKLRNQLTQTDHDSEGLFQQRISIYTKPVADDPVKATNAFLDRLTALPNWQTNPVGVDAQAVQISAFPDRYQPNAALARQLVGQFWPAAAAAAEPPPPAATTNDGSTNDAATSDTADNPGAPSGLPAIGDGPAICPGAGGDTAAEVAGGIVGPRGSTVAGTTRVPAGLVITGSPKAAVAVRFALAQLGKPYRWAAAGPDAYDCSGLTMAAWAKAGVPLPHLAAGQTAYGRPEPTDLSQAVGGDLVMIPGADGTPARPGHVGMVAGYRDTPTGRHLYLVQAPRTGLPVQLTEATNWAGQVVEVRHIA